MGLIGRKSEQDFFSRLMETRKSAFVAVYGRRRVGKTYLIFAGGFSNLIDNPRLPMDEYDVS